MTRHDDDARFGPATRAWFRSAFSEPTEVQRRGWPRIAAGDNVLLIAPTGSGKTLAAFLWCIDRLAHAREGSEPGGVRVLYVSPLKALVYDVERNLRAPLIGIARTAEHLGIPITLPSIAVRTGDTTSKERRLQARQPADILITTPESLYLLLGSQARASLSTVDTIVIDEAHALAPTKRGVHLCLSLERLAKLTSKDPQRISLSATARPANEVARFVGGDRPVTVIDSGAPPRIDLQIIVPVADMTRPDAGRPAGAPAHVPHASPHTASPPAGAPAHVPHASPHTASPPAAPATAEDSLAAEGEPLLASSDSDSLFGDDEPFLAEGEPLLAEGEPLSAGHRSSPAGTPGSFLPLSERGSSMLSGGERTEERGMWPAIYPRLLELIRSHRTTIVFVNSRGLCERLTHRLNELAGEELLRSHHGSLAHSERTHIEELLKTGRVAGIVATSSLELGIDMGAVDLVILVESPASVASGLQRVGRAGHGVGQVSKGRLFPKHRGDLIEAAVVVDRMAAGEIEPLRIPQNPLDVLAQHIVAMVAVEPITVSALRAIIRRSACYRDLPDDALTGVLDMLSGRYPSTDFAELTPRLVWDRQSDTLTARRGARMVAIVNGGTIPNRGTYGVYLGEGGPRVGELDEEMVHETQAGELFTLGATTWRVEQITRDRVLVSPAPGEAGKLPFWRGDGPGRPLELGRAIGAFLREIGSMTPEDAAAELIGRYRLDDFAAANVLAYLGEQKEATGTLPTDRAITLERFRDELGDYRVCILSPFGARVHAPWALAVQARLSKQAGYEVQTMWSDDGIVFRLADFDDHPNAEAVSIDALIPDPEEIEDLILGELAQSALFAGQFRENAARALLLPRRRPNERTPLWVQRLKSQELLGVAKRYPAFPIIMETYRACLQDVFDMPALVELLGAIRSRKVKVKTVETQGPSPFARSLVFAYVAAYLYEGDAPLAERKAQALSLDRRLLRELLGQEELRELLDAEVMDELEAELQGLAESRRVRHADALHDLLRRVGDLTAGEIRARTAPASQAPAGESSSAGSTDRDGDGGDNGDRGAAGSADAMIAELARARRAVAVRIGGEERWIAVEDTAIYRDALGVPPPPGIAQIFLEPAEAPLDALILRYSNTHGPYPTAALASRYGVPAAQAEAWLSALEARGVLVRGELRPGGTTHEWCDPDVLRRIKRRTLARLRNQVSPVEAGHLGSFLPAWHGIGEATQSRGRLEEIITQLEGLPLPYSELESVLLPGRMPDFAPRMLDELGAMGWLVWVGSGALGSRDGKIALYRRDHVAGLVDPPPMPSMTPSMTPAPMPSMTPAQEPDGARGSDRGGSNGQSPAAGEGPRFGLLHHAIVEHLRQRGASFFVAIQGACLAAAGSGGATNDDIVDALWDLVWAGIVSNDTFQPLRALVRGKSAAPQKKGRPGGRSPLASGIVSGRWSLVSELCAGAPSPTERAHRRAVKLLERHGLVSREVAELEHLPGGFAAVYPILRAMEEAGKVRRGYFVEGLGGAQFAFPGAVDRLRGAREAGEGRPPLVLSAIDPANPYGWLLPWPLLGDAEPAPRGAEDDSTRLAQGDKDKADGKSGARRVAGAYVVLIGGEAVLYLDKGGRRLLTFPAAEDRERLVAAARALDAVARRRRGKYLRIETVDSEPASISRHADALGEAGFFRDPRGFVLEVR